jgi:predicted glycosyltransferase
LEKLGLASTLAEADVSAQTVAAAIENALAKSRPANHGLDLDGAWQTAKILRDLLQT